MGKKLLEDWKAECEALEHKVAQLEEQLAQALRERDTARRAGEWADKQRVRLHARAARAVDILMGEEVA